MITPPANLTCGLDTKVGKFSAAWIKVAPAHRCHLYENPLDCSKVSSGWIDSQIVTGNTYTKTGLTGGKYCIHVRACTDLTCSTYSAASICQVSAPPYVEARLVSCIVPSTSVAGQNVDITLNIQPGTNQESYVAVFSGGYVGQSNPFVISPGTAQQQVKVTIQLTAGTQTITVLLKKV